MLFVDFPCCQQAPVIVHIMTHYGVVYDADLRQDIKSKIMAIIVTIRSTPVHDNHQDYQCRVRIIPRIMGPISS